ncbi:MAG: anti-anti-sigma factor [Rhodanobacter sp.]|nr:MAG: anti-anti-sigma factor [Rhodanobacter sp.]TAM11727.1 MAG: anti-anti-sigma factor [Rhodanobacter sp.]TAM36130.1 MAG: anti-anti-sigma factor [Rhodanobacter sp.]
MNQPDQPQHVREHLSAGIDGELSREELRFLLRRLDHDDELRATFMRYHVVRASLHRQLPLLAGDGFAQRVMGALDAETAAVAPRHRWLRWSAGGAIAAGVAVAALMIAQPSGGDFAGAQAPATAAVEPGMAVPDLPSAASSEVAVVPTWLSGKAPGLLSQRASATLGAPLDVSFDGNLSGHAAVNSPISARGYRALDNHDGSYLILLDPAQQPAPGAQRQAASAQ